eukprot:COSAG02_NODE_1601_length_11741_cov_40.329411_11_plen_205_part_00
MIILPLHSMQCTQLYRAYMYSTPGAWWQAGSAVRSHPRLGGPRRPRRAAEPRPAPLAPLSTARQPPPSPLAPRQQRGRQSSDGVRSRVRTTFRRRPAPACSLLHRARARARELELRIGAATYPGDHNVIPGSANMHVHACKQHQNVFAHTHGALIRDWAPALGLLEVQVNSCVDEMRWTTAKRGTPCGAGALLLSVWQEQQTVW